MNVDGTSIKIDMPMSQYGTLELNGRLYNVHVSRLNITQNSFERPRTFTFDVKFLGQEVLPEQQYRWEDSYEAL